MGYLSAWSRCVACGELFACPMLYNSGTPELVPARLLYDSPQECGIPLKIRNQTWSQKGSGQKKRGPGIILLRFISQQDPSIFQEGTEVVKKTLPSPPMLTVQWSTSNDTNLSTHMEPDRVLDGRPCVLLKFDLLPRGSAPFGSFRAFLPGSAAPFRLRRNRLRPRS